MDSYNIKVIFNKEIKSLLREKKSIFFILLLPLIKVLLLSIGIIIAYIKIPIGITVNTRDVSPLVLKVLSDFKCNDSLILTLEYMIKIIAAPLFWIQALIITPQISVDSILGEYENKTLTSILVAPISKRELFIGKILANMCFIFIGIFITWLIFSLSFNTFFYINIKYSFIDLEWILSFTLIVPLLIILSNIFSIIITSVCSSVKIAMQLNTLLAFPMIFYFILHMFIKNFHSELFSILLSIFLIVLNLALFELSIKFFNKERLITS